MKKKEEYLTKPFAMVRKVWCAKCKSINDHNLRYLAHAENTVFYEYECVECAITQNRKIAPSLAICSTKAQREAILQTYQDPTKQDGVMRLDAWVYLYYHPNYLSW